MDTPRVQFTIPTFAFDHVTYKVDHFSDTYGYTEIRTPVELDQAQIISSQRKGTKMHRPLLDIDIPAALIPSSTDGHAHLYLDVTLSWWQYRRLLKALARAGIIEDGYVQASIRRRHTALRLPWIKKDT